jgi:hypothetical protein
VRDLPEQDTLAELVAEAVNGSHGSRRGASCRATRYAGAGVHLGS